MAENVGSIEYEARINTSKLKSDANDAEKHAKQAGDAIGEHAEKGSGRAGRAFEMMSKVAVTALATIATGAVALGISSVKAFMEAETANTALANTLKSTGNVAEQSVGGLNKMATALQNSTGYSDEFITEGQNMLLTFTKIGKDIFPDATKATLDMARQFGGSASDNAIRLGKALNDPIAGVSALGRIGIQFSDVQKEQIQNFVDAGDVMSAQKIILGELTTQTGGASEAYGTTFAGKLDIFKNRLGDVQEEIGELLVKGIMPLLTAGLDWIDQVGGLDGILQQLNKTFAPLITGFMSAYTAISTYLFPKLQELWNAINADLIPALSNLWHNVIEPLIPVFGTLLVGAIGLVIDTATILVQGFGYIYDKVMELNPVVVGLIGVFGALAVAMAFNAIFNALSIGFATLTLVTIPSVMASFGALTALLMSPVVLPALAIGAVLASIAVIWNEWQKTKSAIESAQNSLATKEVSDRNALLSANEQFKAGKISKERYNAMISSAYNGRASGGSVMSNTPYVVGENRDGSFNDTTEMFMPRTSGTILSAKKLSEIIGGQGGNSGSRVENNIGTIYINNQADADRLLQRLTRDDEVISKGLTPPRKAGAY